MKKKLYYALPFIVVPAAMLLCELLDNLEPLNMSFYILAALLLLSSALFGFFSPSRRSVDAWITLAMPLSLFCFLFVLGFLSKNDLETRFHLYLAVHTSLQPFALFLYAVMAITALVFSLKFFRRKRIGP